MCRLRETERRGTAAVEFAIVVPFLLLLLIGMLEFGRAMTVQQILTNASREGARRAVIEGTTAEEVETLVADYLENASISDVTVTCTPSTLGSIGFGDPVSVSVSVSFNDVALVPPWFIEGKNLTASTLMQAERLQ